MSTPSTPHTPENWGAASQAYDEKIAPFTGSYAPELVERLDADETSKVLEVAAGSGALTEVLAPEVGSLLATDFSSEMIERLRARLGAREIANVECAVMNGMALELEDAAFDRVICNFGLMLFPDRSRGFAEMRRVLRPGGRAVVSGWAGPSDFEAFGIFMAALQHAIPDRPAPPAPAPIFSLADPDAFRAEMEAAGFVDARVDLVEGHFDAESNDHLWDMLTSGAPPAKVLLDQIGPEATVEVRASLDGLLRERFGEGSIRLRNVATVGTGVAPS